MQAVVNFLLEYYIWVLAVLGILLITVIGFLADTKRKKKQREMVNKQTMMTDNSNNTNNNVMDFNMGQDMSGGFVNPNMNSEFNMNQGINNSFNPNIGNMNGGFNMNQGINPGIDNSGFNGGVVNPSMDAGNGVGQTTVNNDNFFVPASEQTPNIPPVNVEMPAQANVNPAPVVEPMPVVTPEPVTVVNIPSESTVVPLVTESVVNPVPNVQTPLTPIPNAQGSVPVINVPEPTVNVAPTPIVNPTQVQNPYQNQTSSVYINNQASTIPNNGMQVPANNPAIGSPQNFVNGQTNNNG